MNRIHIKFLTRYLRKDRAKVASIIKRTFNYTLKEESNNKTLRLCGKKILLSVVLVDNARIKDINRKFLGRDRITDVIAFPMSENDSMVRLFECNELQPTIPGSNFTNCRSMGEFGEIIVSVEKAYQESRRRKIPTDGEIVLYCVHGLLHLLGYDDHSVKDSLEMWERQLEILEKIFGKAKARGYLE
ncbi:MAG: rRNA maturation RNase YbeY [Planctomycetota bacterium]